MLGEVTKECLPPGKERSCQNINHLNSPVFELFSDNSGFCPPAPHQQWQQLQPPRIIYLCMRYIIPITKAIQNRIPPKNGVIMGILSHL